MIDWAYLLPYFTDIVCVSKCFIYCKIGWLWAPGAILNGVFFQSTVEAPKSLQSIILEVFEFAQSKLTLNSSLFDVEEEANWLIDVKLNGEEGVLQLSLDKFFLSATTWTGIRESVVKSKNYSKPPRFIV